MEKINYTNIISLTFTFYINLSAMKNEKRKQERSCQIIHFIVLFLKKCTLTYILFLLLLLLLSSFFQVSVCFGTTRTFLDSVSQTGQPLRHVVLVFVTMETPFVIRLYPVHLNYLANASFSLQMMSVAQFSNAPIVVSGKRFVRGI